MRLRWFVLTALAISTVALAADAPVPPSPEAVAYLDRAIALIRAHHRNAPGADWPRIIARAHNAIAGANAPADTYPAISGVLGALGERHSFLVDASATRAPQPDANGTAPPAPPMPRWALAAKRYGIVRLPELNTMIAGGEATGRAYQAALRSGLEQMDKAPLCGWIVDLRQDGGGDMWPMLAGLDPLLGKAPFGFFVMRGQEPTPWIRANGFVYPAPGAVPTAAPAFALAHGAAPLAVLIGPHTASSGEMSAIALIGRARVRTFGAPSAGFTTANRVYPLSDGAMLVITETSIRDRTGRDYVGPIRPDEPADDAEQTAEHWLAGQCA
jgi:hypothetical protein